MRVTPNEIGQAYATCVAEEGHKCEIYGHESGSYDNRKYWSVLTNFLDAVLDSQAPPTAVFCLIPWVARLLIARCNNRGWRVPQDMALVSLDNLKSVVELPPQITCVDSQYDRIGYEAAALLDRLMNGEPSPLAPMLVPPKGMIARESTDFFAVEDEVVAHALHYISKHLDESLSIDLIARKVAVSPRSLQRRFDSVLGRPVSDEIRRLRFALAKRLLGEKDLQIGHIARVTGFNSPVTMNQVFQRELGMSPRAYRKKLMGDRAR